MNKAKLDKSQMLPAGILVEDGTELWTGLRMAKFLGISDRQLRTLVEREIITPTLVTAGGKRQRRYEPIGVIAAYREYKVADALRVQASKKSAVSAVGADGGDVDEQLKRYRMALIAEQTENQKHKNLVNDGTLLYADVVKDDLRRFFVSFKRFALSIPSRMTGMISGRLEPLEVRRISGELMREVKEMLRDFVVAGAAAEEAHESE